MAQATPVEKVTLPTPLKLDGKEVSEITIRMPKTGEMRGINLGHAAVGNTETMIEMLARVTVPPVPSDVLGNMDLYEFTILATALLAFINQGGAGKK